MPSKPIYVASHSLAESDHRSMSIKYTDLMIGREIGRGNRLISNRYDRYQVLLGLYLLPLGEIQIAL